MEDIIDKIKVDIEIEIPITVKDALGKVDWYSERVDEDDGSTHYECHRGDDTKNDYVRFEGVNAQKYCGIFMEAMASKTKEGV